MMDKVQKQNNCIKNEKVNGVVNRPMRNVCPKEYGAKYLRGNEVA
jgi:hypothetical protein